MEENKKGVYYKQNTADKRETTKVDMSSDAPTELEVVRRTKPQGLVGRRTARRPRREVEATEIADANHDERKKGEVQTPAYKLVHNHPAIFFCGVECFVLFLSWFLKSFESGERPKATSSERVPEVVEYDTNRSYNQSR